MKPNPGRGAYLLSPTWRHDMGVNVRQKEKGKGKPWSVFVNENGKRWSRKIGPKDKAEALAHKIREGLALGELRITVEKQVETFGEYARKFLKNVTHLKH